MWPDILWNGVTSAGIGPGIAGGILLVRGFSKRVGSDPIAAPEDPRTGSFNLLPVFYPRSDP